MEINFYKLQEVCGYKTHREVEYPVGCGYKMEHDVCSEDGCPLKINTDIKRTAFFAGAKVERDLNKYRGLSAMQCDYEAWIKGIK